MPRPQLRVDQSAPRISRRPSHRQYLVVREQDVCFIKFNGEAFGPYNTEREAMLFAIDAAQKLGDKGHDTQVLKVDETGKARPAWIYGQDS